MKPHSFPSVPDDARAVPVRASEDRLYRCSAYGGHFTHRSAFGENKHAPRGFDYVCEDCRRKRRGITSPKRVKRVPDEEDYLTCTKCGKRKVSSHFYFYSNRWNSHCRDCHNQRNSESYVINYRYKKGFREERLEIGREYSRKRHRNFQKKRAELRKEVIHLVTVFRTEHRYSVEKIAKVCSVSSQTIFRWINPERYPTLPYATTLQRSVKQLHDELFRVLDSR